MTGVRIRRARSAMSVTTHNASVHGVATKDIAMKNRRDSQLPCNTLLYGSLFSGIGGIDLGFDRAGMKCAWQVEIDPYCRKVLSKHWPEVPKHGDIRTFKPTPVDVVCGGFPCQDISNAGNCAGIEGERSGLWSEYVRIIRDIRPRFVVVENVEALLVRGMGRVLGDLAESGYDAEWDVVPASAFGVPQPRKRVFIMAYRNESGTSKEWLQPSGQQLRISRNPPTSDSREWECWATEPDVPRMANGIPNRLDRVAAIGNAVAPQVAEWIGKRLIESV